MVVSQLLLSLSIAFRSSGSGPAVQPNLQTSRVDIDFRFKLGLSTPEGKLLSKAMIGVDLKPK